MNTIFILQTNGDFEPADLYQAYRGFKYLGYSIFPFEKADLYNLPLTKETIVVGDIKTVRASFDILGVKQPAILSMPPELEEYAYRPIWTSTLGKIREDIEKGSPIFAKPLEHHKLFTGQVFSTFKDLIPTAHLSGDTRVLCSEPVNMIAEFRGYVHKGHLIGLKHYKGDWYEPPQSDTIFKIITEWKDQPIAYSIDIAMVPWIDGKCVEDAYDRKEVLIEINDAFALGNYGLHYIDYAKMIKDRWFEIVSQ